MRDSAENGCDAPLTISPEDLEELEILTAHLFDLYSRNPKLGALFNAYQRQKHIINRIRGYFEE